MPVLVRGHFVGERRTGPHPAHVALDDVQDLGQLVQAPRPQPPPDPGHTGVVLELEEHAAVELVPLQQLGKQEVRAPDHRPELEHGEGPAVLADPLLPVEDRPP